MAVFAEGAAADEARAAGADLVGGEDLIEGIKNGNSPLLCYAISMYKNFLNANFFKIIQVEIFLKRSTVYGEPLYIYLLMAFCGGKKTNFRWFTLCVCALFFLVYLVLLFLTCNKLMLASCGWTSISIFSLEPPGFSNVKSHFLSSFC